MLHPTNSKIILSSYFSSDKLLDIFFSFNLLLLYYFISFFFFFFSEIIRINCKYRNNNTKIRDKKRKKKDLIKLKRL